MDGGQIHTLRGKLASPRSCDQQLFSRFSASVVGDGKTICSRAATLMRFAAILPRPGKRHFCCPNVPASATLPQRAPDYRPAKIIF